MKPIPLSPYPSFIEQVQEFWDESYQNKLLWINLWAYTIRNSDAAKDLFETLTEKSQSNPSTAKSAVSIWEHAWLSSFEAPDRKSKPAQLNRLNETLATATRLDWNISPDALTTKHLETLSDLSKNPQFYAKSSNYDGMQNSVDHGMEHWIRTLPLSDIDALLTPLLADKDFIEKLEHLHAEMESNKDTPFLVKVNQLLKEHPKTARVCSYICTQLGEETNVTQYIFNHLYDSKSPPPVIDVIRSFYPIEIRKKVRDQPNGGGFWTQSEHIPELFRDMLLAYQEECNKKNVDYLTGESMNFNSDTNTTQINAATKLQVLRDISRLLISNQNAIGFFTSKNELTTWLKSIPDSLCDLGVFAKWVAESKTTPASAEEMYTLVFNAVGLSDLSPVSITSKVARNLIIQRILDLAKDGPIHKDISEAILEHQKYYGYHGRSSQINLFELIPDNTQCAKSWPVGYQSLLLFSPYVNFKKSLQRMENLSAIGANWLPTGLGVIATSEAKSVQKDIQITHREVVSQLEYAHQRGAKKFAKNDWGLQQASDYIGSVGLASPETVSVLNILDPESRAHWVKTIKAQKELHAPNESLSDWIRLTVGSLAPDNLTIDSHTQGFQLRLNQVAYYSIPTAKERAKALQNQLQPVFEQACTAVDSTALIEGQTLSFPYPESVQRVYKSSALTLCVENNKWIAKLNSECQIEWEQILSRMIPDTQGYRFWWQRPQYSASPYLDQLSGLASKISPSDLLKKVLPQALKDDNSGYSRRNSMGDNDPSPIPPAQVKLAIELYDRTERFIKSYATAYTLHACKNSTSPEPDNLYPTTTDFYNATIKTLDTDWMRTVQVEPSTSQHSLPGWDSFWAQWKLDKADQFQQQNQHATALTDTDAPLQFEARIASDVHLQKLSQAFKPLISDAPDDPLALVGESKKFFMDRGLTSGGWKLLAKSPTLIEQFTALGALLLQEQEDKDQLKEQIARMSKMIDRAPKGLGRVHPAEMMMYMAEEMDGSFRSHREFSQNSSKQMDPTKSQTPIDQQISNINSYIQKNLTKWAQSQTENPDYSNGLLTLLSKNVSTKSKAQTSLELASQWMSKTSQRGMNPEIVEPLIVHLFQWSRNHANSDLMELLLGKHFKVKNNRSGSLSKEFLQQTLRESEAFDKVREPLLNDVLDALKRSKDPAKTLQTLNENAKLMIDMQKATGELYQGMYKDRPWSSGMQLQEQWHENQKLIEFESSANKHLSWESPFKIYTEQHPSWGTLAAVPMTTAREFFDEGKDLNHCVYSYVTRAKNGESLLFSVQAAGKRTITLELVSRSEEGRSLCFGGTSLAIDEARRIKNFEIVQCKGTHNSTVKDPVLLDFCQKVIPAQLKEQLQTWITEQDLAAQEALKKTESNALLGKTAPSTSLGSTTKSTQGI